MIKKKIKDELEAANVCRDRNLRQQINNHRNKIRPYLGHNPQSLEDIDLSEQLTVTNKGQQFLYYDSGPEDPNRMLIFTTDNNLGILNKSHTSFVDGTFEIAPKLFYQVFTINGIFRGKCLPLVYGLLTRKDEKTYDKFFSALRDGQPNYQNRMICPKDIMVDFEKAIINSIDKHFPDADMSGCYFHITNNLWKQFSSKIGKDKLYIPELRTTLRHLSALPFFPAEDVSDAFDYVKAHAHVDLNDLIDYFEKTYIGKITSKGKRKCSYMIEFWNQFERTKSGIYMKFIMRLLIVNEKYEI